jgi:hypothetical protein
MPRSLTRPLWPCQRLYHEDVRNDLLTNLYFIEPQPVHSISSNNINHIKVRAGGLL